MKPMRFLILLVATAVVGNAFSQSADTTPAPEAPAAEAETRNAVLDLAGAFSNDGYKIRDGFWFSDLEPGKSATIQVNLFAGNEYWFCAASNASDAKLKVTVYDETGALVDQQEYEDGSRAAAGVVADRSGPYYVKVKLADGAEKAPFSLIYCYK